MRGRLQPECVFPRGAGVLICNNLWVQTDVDDSLRVSCRGGDLRARLGHLRLKAFACSETATRGSLPSLLGRKPRRRIRTRMAMLGWVIDTLAMTTSVSQEKVTQLQAMLAEAGRERVATVKEVGSLLGKLLHLCEGERPGKCFVGGILNQLG